MYRRRCIWQAKVGNPNLSIRMLIIKNWLSEASGGGGSMMRDMLYGVVLLLIKWVKERVNTQVLFKCLIYGVPHRLLGLSLIGLGEVFCDTIRFKVRKHEEDRV